MKVDRFKELIEAQGGFGRFQWMAFIMIVLGMNSPGYLVYSLPYLLLYPEFDCQVYDGSVWQHVSKENPLYNHLCIPDYFCKNNATVRWDIVQNSHLTLRNWIWQYDMTCAPILEISMFGIMFL